MERSRDAPPSGAPRTRYTRTEAARLLEHARAIYTASQCEALAPTVARMVAGGMVISARAPSPVPA